MELFVIYCLVGNLNIYKDFEKFSDYEAAYNNTQLYRENGLNCYLDIEYKKELE
jgi:hypothetical protein